MAQPCATCEHPQVREINHRMREGLPLTDISRWLKELGQGNITRQALARHMRSHLGATPRHGGRRGAHPDFLKSIVENVAERMDAGELEPTIKDGIAAQKEVNRLAEKTADRDLMLRIALALTGNVIEGDYREIDGDQAELEAEFRPLLTAGT